LEHVFRMHGTVEWLPGQPLGNDRKSWSDELLGSLPNIYIYAANNPSGKFQNYFFLQSIAFSKLMLSIQRVFSRNVGDMERW
jgi:hypothetical protein